MALYRVDQKGEDRPRLVEAAGSAEALRHVANSTFDVKVIQNPADAAKLAAQGIQVEEAGKEPPPAPEQGHEEAE